MNCRSQPRVVLIDIIVHIQGDHSEVRTSRDYTAIRDGSVQSIAGPARHVRPESRHVTADLRGPGWSAVRNRWPEDTGI